METHAARSVGAGTERFVGRLAGRPVLRMNGIGNAIVVLDLRGCDLVVTEAEARTIAAMPGLAFDQLMVVHDSVVAGIDAELAIHNTDGSRSGACGNGTRCAAWYLLRDSDADRVVVLASGSRLECRRLAPWWFAVDMGRPVFEAARIPVIAADGRAPELDLPADNPFRHPFVVGMGNPHAVFFVPDAEAVDLPRFGPAIETAAAFPERANVSFATVVDRSHLRLRVWERGAGATLGCGTGACASLVAAAVTGRADRRAHVDLPGGTLEIVWGDDDHVTMSGPVELEWEGVMPSADNDVAEECTRLSRHGSAAAAGSPA